MRLPLFVCVLLAACSRDKPAPSPGSSSGALASAPAAYDDGTCRYLEPAEAAQLLGAPVAAAVPGKGRCSYTTQDAKRGSVMLVIALEDGQGVFERQQRVFPRAQPLGDLGEQAFGLGPMVAARFGARFVSLSAVVPAAPDAVSRGELARLVRVIGARLP